VQYVRRVIESDVSLKLFECARLGLNRDYASSRADASCGEQREAPDIRPHIYHSVAKADRLTGLEIVVPNRDFIEAEPVTEARPQLEDHAAPSCDTIWAPFHACVIKKQRNRIARSADDCCQFGDCITYHCDQAGGVEKFSIRARSNEAPRSSASEVG
jgi:hypothetical protein